MSDVQDLLDREAERVIRFTLEDGSQPDLPVVCESFKFLVHEKQVVEKCKFFEKTMSVDWKEKSERRIVIQEKSPFIIQALLFYIYSGTYHDALTNASEQDPPLTFNVKMHAAADEYQMDDLKNLATANITKALTDLPNDPIGDAATAIDLVYNHIRDEGSVLKTAIVKSCAKHFSKLSTKKQFEDAMFKVPGFAAGVAYAMFNQSNTYNCPQPRCYGTIATMQNDIVVAATCRDCRQMAQDIHPYYMG